MGKDKKEKKKKPVLVTESEDSSSDEEPPKKAPKKAAKKAPKKAKKERKRLKPDEKLKLIQFIGDDFKVLFRSKNSMEETGGGLETPEQSKIWEKLLKFAREE